MGVCVCVTSDKNEQQQQCCSSSGFPSIDRKNPTKSVAEKEAEDLAMNDSHPQVAALFGSHAWISTTTRGLVAGGLRIATRFIKIRACWRLCVTDNDLPSHRVAFFVAMQTRHELLSIPKAYVGCTIFTT